MLTQVIYSLCACIHPSIKQRSIAVISAAQVGSGSVPAARHQHSTAQHPGASSSAGWARSALFCCQRQRKGLLQQGGSPVITEREWTLLRSGDIPEPHSPHHRTTTGCPVRSRQGKQPLRRRFNTHSIGTTDLPASPPLHHRRQLLTVGFSPVEERRGLQVSVGAGEPWEGMGSPAVRPWRATTAGGRARRGLCGHHSLRWTPSPTAQPHRPPPPNPPLLRPAQGAARN